VCGIAGILNAGGRPADPVLLDRMTDALAHRGPDGRGVWIDGPVGLGHRRLAIRDLSDAGRQPMAGPAGDVVVTYNGEIYNDAELRREIEAATGYRYRSTCDSETIPVAYALWGDEAFARFEGMFAVALWDARRRRLVLARDGVGIKPLYWAEHAGGVRFASEIKALLRDPALVRRLEPQPLQRYLGSGYVSPDETMLPGVRQVPPGTLRIIDPDGARETPFWRPRRAPSIRRLDEAVEAVGSALRTVVGDMLVSDVEVGVLLSGGVDSALVARSLSAHRPVPAFTAAFAERSHDESRDAAVLARACGLPHRTVTVDADDDVAARLREVALASDGHLADASALAFHRLCQAVRAHVTVALTGDGGDEFFGGYPTYRASRIAARIGGALPRPLWRLLARAALVAAAGDERRVPPLEKVGRFAAGLAGPPGHAHAQWRRHCMDWHLDALRGPALRPFAGALPTAPYADAYGGRTGGIDRLMEADQRHYLPADLLAKADSASMAHGLEVRVPLLDRRIMDLAGTIHADLLTPPRGPDKLVLRRLLDRMGGAPAASAPKQGFNVPIARLLRGPLRALGDRLLDAGADRWAPALDPGGVRALWHAHLDRRANNAYPVWGLLVLGLWLDEHGIAAG